MRMAVCLVFTVAGAWTAAGVAADDSPGLAIAQGPTGKAYLTFGGAPLLAFGPGDEMRLLGGGADVERWAAWQQAHGMNLVRAYPTSVPISVYGAEGLHPFLQRDGKWNVDAFNDAYFAHLGEAAETLEDHGIILHLQLWQIVFFKGGSARWDANYLNPANNVNEWTHAFSRGHDYIDAPQQSPARRHQREWVRRILDALKGRNNVWIDVINELGNEMGTLEWAQEVASWIRAWEAENGQTFLVGVDSEHHYRPDRFGPYQDVFDLIILNELRNPGHARHAIAHFEKPAVSVRSSDGTNRWEDYLFARPEQTGPEHQTRYRTLCYRSVFSGLQAIGAYWKPQVEDADYRAMEHWPGYAEALRAFWDVIAPEWPELTPDDALILGEGLVTPHAYALRSPRLIAVYLECGSHTWNNEYPESTLEVTCGFPEVHAELFNPRTGERAPAEIQLEDGRVRLSLPAFVDDVVVLLWSGAAPGS
jgi:hypothetical protein